MVETRWIFSTFSNLSLTVLEVSLICRICMRYLVNVVGSEEITKTLNFSDVFSRVQ